MSFDVFGGLSALGGGFIGYIIPFLFVLTLVVFFHVACFGALNAVQEVSRRARRAAATMRIAQQCNR